MFADFIHPFLLGSPTVIYYVFTLTEIIQKPLIRFTVVTKP